MSIPRGFYEVAPQNQLPQYPTFVRGVLISRKFYDGLTFQQKHDLLGFPRNILYGGPLPNVQTAQEWNDTLFFWAQSTEQVWLPDGIVPSVIPGDEVKWPADSSFKWTWVQEPKQPTRYITKWDSQHGKWAWYAQN